MDQPSGSNTNNQKEVSDTEISDVLPISRMKINPNDDGNKISGSESENNAVARAERPLPSVEDIIAECEIQLKKYMKRRRLQSDQSAGQSSKSVEYTDEESSSSSSVSLSSSSENIFIYYNEEADYARREDLERKKKKEKLAIGSWLFLSYIEGGWNYDEMKNFLKKEYGVKCLRSKTISEKLAEHGEFKAVIKFQSHEELNEVIKDLRARNFRNKFLFFSFDIPITYFDSDDDI